jgi:hypothetical protein
MHRVQTIVRLPAALCRDVIELCRFEEATLDLCKNVESGE